MTDVRNDVGDETVGPVVGDCEDLDRERSVDRHPSPARLFRAPLSLVIGLWAGRRARQRGLERTVIAVLSHLATGAFLSTGAAGDNARRGEHHHSQIARRQRSEEGDEGDDRLEVPPDDLPTGPQALLLVYVIFCSHRPASISR